MIDGTVRGLRPSPGSRRRAADLRREETVSLLNERGSMSPSALAAHFDVSVMTVHRDLNELQRRGVILKSHGGVTAQPAGVFETTLAFRETHMVRAKAAIAARAVALVRAGATVVLDDSTTVAHLVPLLVDRAPVTVATTSLSALVALANSGATTVLALGGDYDAGSDSFLGVVTERDVAAIRVDVAFVSASGVADGRAWHADQHLVAVKRAMISAAAEAYLLVDHTKLGRSALHAVGSVDEFSAVVVDGDADPTDLEALRSAGARVETA